MKATTISIHGTDYDLATSLRVAFEVQGKHSHESYMKIFSKINEMTLEEQLDILYIAFKIANSETAKTFSNQMFREYYYDNYTVSDIMAQLNGVISGVLGKDLDELAEKQSQQEEDNSGN